MGGTVAVTGGTGFIGGHIASSLRRAGWRVRVLVRPGHPAAAFPATADRITGTLHDDRALDTLLAGAQALVHCAGVVRGGRAADFEAVNVDGVRRAARAARAAGAYMVHLSSLAARHPKLSHYAASKAAGEAVLAASGTDYSVLRPPAVYGPGERELRPLLESMRRGLVLVPAARAARFSLLYVEDLAAAVLALIGAPAPERVFELDDGHPHGYGWDELAAAVARHTGRRVRQVPVPRALLRAAAGLNAGLARLTGRAPMLTPGKIRELTWPDWVADGSAFAAHTGWRARVGLDEGLARTFAAARTEER